jgi:hypothetical protein
MSDWIMFSAKQEIESPSVLAREIEAVTECAVLFI